VIDPHERRPFSLIGIIVVTGTLLIVAACLTIVFLAMRSVMDIGGFCAEGGPYEIETHCPKGTPGLLMGGIWIGVIAAFAYVWQASRYRALNLGGLLWPALFLSLGWNFLEYGVSPPFEGGLAWGWLIPGGVFVLMGGLPLFWVIPALVRPDDGPSNTVGFALRQGAGAARHAASQLRVTAAPSRSEGLVDALERLDRLHRRGRLSDAEYEAAKQRLLEGA
jgi:hypothetical protein